MSRRAAIIGGAAVAVVVGALAAALVAASGDDDPGPVAGRTPSTPAATDKSSPTSAPEASGGAAQAPTPTETETDGSTTPTPATPPPEPPSSAGDSAAKHRVVTVPPARVFAGKGTRWLGTIDVAKPAVVRWSGLGKLSIRFGRERYPVVAPSSEGQLVVPPYRFQLVRVVSKGTWRIEIKPQG